MNLKINNEKAKEKLLSYISKIENYDNFDIMQKCRVFNSQTGDFVGFESIRYNLSFIASNHKLLDIKSCDVIKVTLLLSRTA